MGQQKAFFTRPWVVVLGACICTALWGSATPAIKIGYQLFQISAADLPSKMLFAGTRFLLAGCMVLLVTTLCEKRFPMPKQNDWAPIALLGMLQTSLQYVFFYIGLSYTTGAKGSLFSSVSGFLVVLAAPLVYRGNKAERLTLQKFLGCLLALGGLICINLDGGIGALSGFKLAGEGAVFLSAVFFAISFFYSKHVTRTRDPKMVSGWQLLMGGLVLVAVGWATGGQIVFYSSACWVAMVYLSFLSAVAFTLWSILLANNPVGRVSVFHLLTPIFGTVLSGIFLQETILTVANISALVLVCTGVWLVNTQILEKRKALAASRHASSCSDLIHNQDG